MSKTDQQLDPTAILADRFRAAIARAFPDAADADPAITASKQPKLGDFQCNAAMALAKRFGKNPREVAAAIVAAADLAGIAEPLTAASIAGPGFINIRLSAPALGDLLGRLDSPSLGVPRPANPQTIIVDLFGVNIAKEMHVGHIRATAIGDAIARTFERLGHRVIRQNHVGDWGVPIAMVVLKVKDEADAGRLSLSSITLPQLTNLYREAQAECAADTAGLEAARRTHAGPKALAELEEQVAGAQAARARVQDALVKLQAHEPGLYSVWQRLFDLTMDECLAVCRRLNTRITEADSAGESTYAAELAPMVTELVARGIAVESDGALVVRLEEFGIDVPCIVRKRDGGFVYATTDIAAIRRRVQKLGGDRVIYAVGAPQSLHLRQVFAAATKAGYATRVNGTPASLEHAAFGSIMGEDHRPFKTRSGENVLLADLLDEAAARAERIVAERSPDAAPEERRRIADTVGIAAIKYADLSIERIKDYVFSFDRMIEPEGNTGPYLLYALARIRSIFRKGAERGLLGAGEDSQAPLRIAEPAERQLALALLRYPGALAGVAATAEPHHLCANMFDIATAFAAFYDQCPVLAAPDEPTRLSRLRLCGLAGRVLADGLETLGIPTLERM